MAATNRVSVHIPDDLSFSILSKLPLKSLKRFTSACKSWSLLFENSHFMNMFRSVFISKNHSFYDDTCLLLHQSPKNHSFHDKLYMLFGERFDFKDRVILDWPPHFQENDSCIRILGSCSVNGTLCLYQGFAYDVITVLWNPATKQFKVIPPSRQPYENIEFNLSPRGFGYDRVRDDYKVLRSVQYPREFEGNWVYVPEKEDSFWEMDLPEPYDRIWEDRFWEFSQVDMYDPFWEIYSLRNNSWRKLDGVDLPDPWSSSSVVNSNEMCHWLGMKNDMVSFDFSNEIFFTTTLPSSNMKYELVVQNLEILNGYVALICNYDHTTHFHIWILGELGFKESWTKLFVVGPLTCVARPIGTGKKGRIFLRKRCVVGRRQKTSANLALFDFSAWFDLSTRRIEEIEVEGESHCLHIVIYKENFLPMGGVNN